MALNARRYGAGCRARPTLQAQCGKIVIARIGRYRPVEYRCHLLVARIRSDPVADTQLIPHRSGGHEPKAGAGGGDSTMLIDATLKHPTSPLALPAKPFMENAQNIWND